MIALGILCAVACGVSVFLVVENHLLLEGVRASLRATREARERMQEFSALQNKHIDALYGEIHEVWSAIADEEDAEDEEDDEPPSVN